MQISETHMGILLDIAANKISLDDCSEWMRGQLGNLVLHDPMLIDTVGPSVFLTEAGVSAVLGRK